MYRVSGAVAQGSINGVYNKLPAAQTVHNHSYYMKSADRHGSRRVMYWHPQNGGQWVIADHLGLGFRAVETGGATPAFGPPQSDGSH